MDALILLTVWSAVTACLVAAFGRQLWRELSPFPKIYLVLSWAIVSIGVIQTMFTALRFEQFDEAALWFATAGMAIALTGAMNLLNLGRHLEDAGVRRVCLVANLAMTVVFVAVATHRGAEPPHDPVSVMLMTVAGLATLLGSGSAGLRRRPARRAS
jgi:hypothetical protein